MEEVVQENRMRTALVVEDEALLSFELREYLERSSAQRTRGEGVVILHHAGRDRAGTRARKWAREFAQPGAIEAEHVEKLFGIDVGQRLGLVDRARCSAQRIDET